MRKYVAIYLLNILLQALRHAQVHDGAHKGGVNTHAKGHSCYHHPELALTEHALH